MPLSDDERDRLAALEHTLEHEDPDLARRITRLHRHFPGDRLWFRHRWVLITICAVASAALLVVTIAGAMPLMRTFAILLNVYVALLAALLAFSQRGKGH